MSVISGPALQYLRDAEKWEYILTLEGLHPFWLLEADLEVQLSNSQKYKVDIDKFSNDIKTFLNDDSLFDARTDIRLVWAKGLTQLDDIPRAVRIFQRTDVREEDARLRTIMLAAEMLFVQAYKFKKSLLDIAEKPRSPSGYNFVVAVVRKLYDKGCRLLGFTIGKSLCVPNVFLKRSRFVEELTLFLSIHEQWIDHGLLFCGSIFMQGTDHSGDSLVLYADAVKQLENCALDDDLQVDEHANGKSAIQLLNELASLVGAYLVADEADVADATNVADAADVADTHDVADAADVADTHDVADAADVADTHNVADAADVVDTPDVADTPNVADAADVADTPNVAGAPNVAEAADEADVADATEKNKDLESKCDDGNKLTGTGCNHQTLWKEATLLKQKFLEGFKVHLVNPLTLQKASWDHYIVSASGTTAAGLPDGDSDGFTVTVDKDEVDHPSFITEIEFLDILLNMFVCGPLEDPTDLGHFYGPSEVEGAEIGADDEHLEV